MKAKGGSLPTGLGAQLEQRCCSARLHLPTRLFLPGFLPDAVLLSRWPLRSRVRTALVSVCSPPAAARAGARAPCPFRSKEPFHFLHSPLLSPGFTFLKDRSGFSKCGFLLVTFS